ncbi:4Fe-4S dicluster domain-containing protein [Deltaproteobacteria bacterium TL4]
MSSSQTSVTSKAKGMLTDVTKCIGCERCVEACVRINKLPRDFLGFFKASDGLSANRLTAIVKTPGTKAGTWRMVRRHCMHCVEPSCASACLVGAFKKTEDGAVDYDTSKCIGCRYCMLACPFTIPRYAYDKPLPYMRKCKMNAECRVEGGMPACVSACPTGATVFGPRDFLLKEAKRRIKENPERYMDHIYGETEFGGTSIMYISDTPLNQAIKMPTKAEFKRLRLPQLAEKSIPSLLHNWVLVTPIQFFTVMAGLCGIWFFRRRSKLMSDASKKKHDPQTPDSNKDKVSSTHHKAGGQK